MTFEFKSFQNILKDSVANFLSATGVNDINPGSVVTTFLEAPAQEDAQQYFQMYQIIRNYNLDTTEGDDLDNRARELTDGNVERFDAAKGSGVATISDSAITKVLTNVYSGSRGPVAGQTYIDVDDGSSLGSSGSVIIGRNTSNVETVAFSSVTSFSNFSRVNLSGALTNDHGTDETVILSQGGDRLISSGTVVLVPASDVNDEIQFVTKQDATILDGDSEVTSVPIEAVSAGGDVISAGTIIEFNTLPFATAEVTNPQAITNGRDRETDDELRDRIKDYIQSLSRGVKAALVSAVIDLQDDEDNKRIVSANLIEPTTLDDIVYLYVDDGTGLEPSFDGIGVETIIDEATGGERFLQLDQFPVVKAQIESLSSQPFLVTNGQALTVAVNGVEETITFQASDFAINGSVSAYEIAQAINSRATLVEGRTSGNGTKVVLRAVENENEQLAVVGGTANTAIGFPTSTVYSAELYRFDGDTLTKLSKDGTTASIECGNDETYNLSGTETLTIVVDGKTANTQTVTFQAGDFAVLGAATAEEVVDRINTELAGATASATSEGQRVTLTSNTERSSLSMIRVTGGTANSALGFSTSTVVGADKDYTMNRFNGQIELESVAIAGEQYTAGSESTRGFIISANAELYVLADGDTITLSVDGGGSKVVTFNTADFSNIAQATAEEVAAVINQDAAGATASVTDDNKVLIRTNSWSESYGSIEVTAVGGTATALGFEVSSERTSLQPHAAYRVSAAGPYSFSEGDELIIVVDKDDDQAVFNVTMDIDGTITTGDASPSYDRFIADITSLSQNFSLKFTNDTDLVGWTLKWLTGDNSPGTSIVNSYNSSTGQMVLFSAVSNSIDVGDTFTLIPTTAANVVVFLSSTVTSSLPTRASIELANDGDEVQISSLTFGTAGLVQVTGGDANDELSFSTTASTGRDGYAYYTGIVAEVQHTIDGLDDDAENYPGVKAAGVQVEVIPPVVRVLTINIDLDFAEDADQNLVKDKAINLISSYVNSLGVGDDLVLTELTRRLKGIDGVNDVGYNEPSANVPIADNEIARVARDQITVG